MSSKDTCEERVTPSIKYNTEILKQMNSFKDFLYHLFLDIKLCWKQQ